MFDGIVIQESLKDKTVLGRMEVLSIRETDDEDFGETWHIHRVRAEAEQLAEVLETLKHGFYAHFWHEGMVIVIFPGRMFKFRLDDHDARKPVVAYGLSQGIPAEQLDFPVE